MGDDWSSGRLREMLESQRRFLWREDTLPLLARWMGIAPGTRVVDAGCGLGYLGAAFRPAFGEAGLYVGVDVSAKLLEDARALAADWAAGARARFLRGDASALPLRGGFADLAVCQTLLMHLAEPEGALAELVRVCRPGGVVACVEPDNPAASLRGCLRNPYGLDLEDRLFLMRVNLYMYRGRRRLGRGDHGIGGRLNRLMREAGLVSIDVRLCDRINHVEPPYEGEIQQWLLSVVRKSLARGKGDPEGLDRFREEVLAGGGTEAEIERYLEVEERRRLADRDALERGAYFALAGGPFYAAIGRKP
jgi:ubiquinone/menaquinone biosynthesis C-methylase UbiE